MKRDRQRKTDPSEHLTPANMVGLFPIGTDPLGSYTGRPEDLKEVPIQDADDL